MKKKLIGFMAMMALTGVLVTGCGDKAKETEAATEAVISVPETEFVETEAIETQPVETEEVIETEEAEDIDTLEEVTEAAE